MPAWRHAKCFLEIGWWTRPMEKMSGWDKLSEEDKKAIQSMAEQYIEGGKLGITVFAILPSGKPYHFFVSKSVDALQRTNGHNKLAL
jgi:hypothetical protein